MEVTVHYPDSEEAELELKKAAARIQAALIAGRIKKLPCSDKQKKALIKDICKELSGRNNI